jgi:oligopeptide/dipeptide ABC transporter ATP-binding protein
MEALSANQKRVHPPGSTDFANDDLLRLRDLSVVYRGRAAEHESEVLKQISFAIAPREIVGVLGESGSGKTTTALAILRLLGDSAQVTSGSIQFLEENLLAMDPRRLRSIRGSEISIIYQDSDVLNPVMRVGDQVTEVLRAHRKSSGKQMQEEVNLLLGELGFSDCDRIFRAYPHQLSGGERRRIAIAQALICKPRLVIADEPTAWLDSGTTTLILTLFERLRDSHDTAFLLISHDPETLSIADRVMVMYAGEIVEDGPVEEVFTRPLHPYTNALLQCASYLSTTQPAPPGHRQRLFCISGQAPDPAEVFSGCSFASRCGERMPECDSQPPAVTDASATHSVRCFKYADGI